MVKRFILAATLGFLWCLPSVAQKAINTKVDSAAYKLTQSGGNVGSALDSLKGSWRRITGKGANTAGKASPSTCILVTNISYDRLKTLEDGVRSIKGVKATTKTYAGKGVSRIDVSFGGSADKLWDQVNAQAKQGLQVDSLDAGHIWLAITQ